MARLSRRRGLIALVKHALQSGNPALRFPNGVEGSALCGVCALDHIACRGLDA